MMQQHQFVKLQYSKVTEDLAISYLKVTSKKHEAYSWNMYLLLIKNKVKTGLLVITMMVKMVE